MKTITEAINERLSHTRTLKKMDAEYYIEELYRKHPALKKLDADIFDVRTSRMICSIEHDKDPLPALEKREDDLLKEKEKYLKDHNIPEDYTDTRTVCQKCADTGFTSTSDGRRVVCTSCMKDALSEVYNESGMKDFATYTVKSFDINYDKDRKRMFAGLRRLMEGSGDKAIMVLTGPAQTGKTYLSIVACKYAILQGLSAYYVKADRMTRLSYDDLDELKTYDLVIIDDFSAEITKNDWTASVLHNLLEARLASGRATVIVSSSPLAVLVSDSDERIAGKLRTAGAL